VTGVPVIVFDSTSSMGPEIETVKTRVIEIGGALLRKIPRARIGFTTYKDVTDSPGSNRDSVPRGTVY
jgi:hypothetical protein